MQHSITYLLFAVWIALLTAARCLEAALIDNFENGIDERWFVVDTNLDFNTDGTLVGPKAWGPGVFETTAGSLTMATAGTVSPNGALPPGPEVFDTFNSGLLALGWGPSTNDPTFSNGLIRAKVRVDNPSNVDLALRTDPSTFSGYVMAALGSYGQFRFSRLDNGVIARDEIVPGLVFSPGEDWMMEFGAIGSELSMKAWKVGDTEPAQPQFTVTDGTYDAGVLGIISSISTNNIPEPTAVAGTFDDVTFTPILPRSRIRVISPSEFADREAPAVNTVDSPLRYHQIYPDSDFQVLDGVPHLITEIAFRPDRQRIAPSTWSIDDAEIRLAYTEATSNSISSRFDSNFGTERTLVYGGPLTLTSGNVVNANGTKGFDQVVELQTPFRYDPTGGNLLMEVLWKSRPSGALLNDGGGPPAVIALNPSAVVGNRIGGLPTQFTLEPIVPLRAGDADQDSDFDQMDLVQVQIASKYLTGQAASWGEGDWNGAPGGFARNPPAGDGLFNQFDIIAANVAGVYLQGPYAAVQTGGIVGDDQVSLVYQLRTGELSVDAPVGRELSSINVTSAEGRFTGSKPIVLDGAFDNFESDNVFKATFGGSFGSISFGHILPAGLAEDDVRADLSAAGSLAGGGGLGDVDLVYVPESTSAILLVLGLVITLARLRCVHSHDESEV